MVNAVYIAGGSAYDAIIVKNGVIMVDGALLNDFLRGGDFDSWEALWGWDEWDVDFDAELIYDAAIDVADGIGGKIAAYWEDDELIIVDNDLLQDRIAFYNR